MEISAMGCQMPNAADMEAMRQKMFSHQDTDGNGGLDAEELTDMSEKTGVSVEDILEMADSDGDGLVSETELTSSDMPPPPPPNGRKGGPGSMGGSIDDSDADPLKALIEQFYSESDDSETEADQLKAALRQFQQNSSYEDLDLSSGLFVNQTA
ncbi:MAG: hypothetical protein EOL87_04360 [Spartobacteria bacterium]|nr:hypothetical protein [Spartobacteria bacterium]